MMYNWTVHNSTQYTYQPHGSSSTKHGRKNTSTMYSTSTRNNSLSGLESLVKTHVDSTVSDWVYGIRACGLEPESYQVEHP